ncbi:MAG: hypothetical protein ACFFBR_06080 [Promethearchaeota archaeon]
MKRLPMGLVLLAILVLPFTLPVNFVRTEDCFVQIVSVTINQSSVEIGEQLEANLVYDLYYDQMDPLGIGAIGVSIRVQGTPSPLIVHEFTNTGFGIHEVIAFDISAYDWSPNETGQIGEIQIEGWVQDSIGSMTDQVQQQFIVHRSNLLLEIYSQPMQITFHEILNLSGALSNPHNSSLDVSNHPMLISVIQNNQTIKSWNSQTDIVGNFTHPINSSVLGTGDFSCKVFALNSDDYKTANSSVSFNINPANISLSVMVNTTSVQTYYPLMKNSSLLVSASLQCDIADHEFKNANVTCHLGNITKTLAYTGSNTFSTAIEAPSIAGEYVLAVSAITYNHSLTNTSIPIMVEQRDAILILTPNCTEATLGDTIGFTLKAVDFASLIPISTKTCSIYLYNQSAWTLLIQVQLDYEGLAQFQWQTQNVGDNDFLFKAIFHGLPEYNITTINVNVTNTHDIRFICDSILHRIRPDHVEYVIQLTTLDFQPISNISISLIECVSNTTWCVSITNSSGFATLVWDIEIEYPLGQHEFYLSAEQGTTLLETIQITVLIFEQTVLELV